MSLELYHIWLEDPATATAEDAIRAQIQSAGLLESGGLATERIATDQIDLSVNGQFRLGENLSRRVAMELESIGASTYSAVPLFATDTDDPRRGYYEVRLVDVQPAHPTTTGAYQYTVALSESGSHETHWRGMRTESESISHNLATGSEGEIGLDHRATKVRWFDPDPANSTESATVQSTVEGELGSIQLYDPTEPTFTNPILLYELDFGREYRTDCVVWDDRGYGEKFYRVSEGGTQYDNEQYDNTSEQQRATATQWAHIYDNSHEYDGVPIVENRRVRIRFDEPNEEIEAWQWDANASAWSEVAIDHSDYSLFDADIEAIGPADVTAYVEWEDTSTGDIDPVVLKVQRGLDEVVMRVPENESSIPTDLENQLSPIVSDQTTDKQPSQTIIRREEVK